MLIKIKDLYEQLFKATLSGDDTYSKPQLQARVNSSDLRAEHRSEVNNQPGTSKEETQ